MRALLFLSLAHVAAAQPSGEALLDGWVRSWEAAAAGASSVSMDEAVARTFVGPRQETVLEVDARLTYDLGGPPARTVRRVRVDGRDVPAERESRHRGRLGRAFGPAGREVAAPPLLPAAVLGRSRARSVAPDRVGGVPAWRVALEVGPRPEADRADAWFARDDGRLLRLRLGGRRPRGGRIERDVRFTRVAGLDLPASATAEFTVRQRRRLRDYVVTLASRATYSGHAVR